MKRWLKEFIREKIMENINFEAAIEEYVENVIADIDVTKMIANRIELDDIEYMIEEAFEEYIND